MRASKSSRELHLGQTPPRETQKLLAVGFLHLNQAHESESAAAAFLQTNHEDSYANYIRGLAILEQDDVERARVAFYEAGYNDTDVDIIRQVVMQVPVDVNQRRSTITARSVARDETTTEVELMKSFTTSRF